MQGANYFIEQFRDKRKPETTFLRSPGPLPIEWLDRALRTTTIANDLITVAVFKIKLKPGIVIGTNEEDTEYTITAV